MIQMDFDFLYLKIITQKKSQNKLFRLFILLNIRKTYCIAKAIQKLL